MPAPFNIYIFNNKLESDPLEHFYVHKVFPESFHILFTTFLSVRREATFAFVVLHVPKTAFSFSPQSDFPFRD